MKKLSVRPSGAGLGNTNFLVPNCPFFIVVPNCPFLHGGAKLSVFTWRCQIVRGAKLSVLHDGAKLSGCQIVRFYIAVPNCPFFIAVPNCPRCQIVLGSSLNGVPTKQLLNVTLAMTCDISPPLAFAAFHSRNTPSWHPCIETNDLLMVASP